MKTTLTLAILALSVNWATLICAAPPDEAMKADMEKCAVCKHLAANPALLQNMSWETFKIDNGMLCVMSAPKEMKSELEALFQKMEAEMERIKADKLAGKEVEVCALCASMGELMETGAKEQEIKTATGMIHLMTSADPAVVQKIHASADQAIAMQKHMASE